MNISLQAKTIKLQGRIDITGSKSESNRLLLLQALYPNIRIDNLSNADDTKIMQRALTAQELNIDIHHAGTAMRFLTAYYAAQPNRNIILTGSQRMQQRPIKILVDALAHLGANIDYTGVDGYPPLDIKGTIFDRNEVSLTAGVSSQYISALMLIAPKLMNGLQIQLQGTTTSMPYIRMTARLMQDLGIEVTFDRQSINISPQKNIDDKLVVIESDWSSASYYYSLIALADIGSQLTLSTYKKDSLQGDSALINIYESFGVQTTFNNGYITLDKTNTPKDKSLILDLSDTPDIAQTIVVSCFGLGMSCELTGLHTLKIKETDRLSALQKELEKLGANLSTTSNALHLNKSSSIRPEISIATYHDHRMAMAFAPLCLKVPITILNAEEVNKSYPDFWRDWKQFSQVNKLAE